MYYTPIFRNMLVIYLLRAFSYDNETKYLTSGTQQRYVPYPGSCIAYQAHITFSEYLEDPGRISVVAEIVEAIETLIPEHFHPPLSTDEESSLHIPPFNISN